MATLETIRRAEAESHTQAYSTHELFTPGSWLAKPVKTVLELLPLFADRKNLRALDLGCGVGRNCTPVADVLDAQVDCVDILPLAIEKLRENAAIHGVHEKISGFVSGIDEFEIKNGHYDLILAISALEHMDSAGSFTEKLQQIREGLRPGGILCLIVNSGVTEQNTVTGAELPPQFEVNLPTSDLQQIFHQVYSGMDVLKETVVLQEYDIPRENALSHLKSRVVTFVARR